jgi:succinoglycan biosynthesis transport protein ExoP
MLELIRVWRRRKWLAIQLFVLPFTAITSVVVFMPNIYQSTATVLVERQQVPEAFVKPTVTSELETRLRTISQETLSRSRLETLINRFGLYADLKKAAPPEAIIERMRSEIRLDLRGQDVRGRGSTIAFALSYRGRDPETVAQVTNALASFYIEENLKARERQATGTAEFLKVQLEDARKRLDEQERHVSAFKKRFAGELPEQMAANLATVEQLNAQLRLNSISRLRLDEKREMLAMQLADPRSLSSAAMGTPTAAGEQEADATRLIRLKHQLDESASRYTDDHPAIVRRKAEIAVVEQRLRRRTEAKAEAKPGSNKADVPSPAALSPQETKMKQALAETETEIKVLKDEDVRLRRALATHEARVVNTPQREQEFQELSRDYQSTKELYQSLLKRHDEAQLAESMELRQKGEQFRILDPALASAVPAAPKRPRLILMALALSLGLAVGAVAMAEQFNTSLHTIDAVRRFTTVPVLVSIPRLVADVDSRLQWRFRLAATGTVLALVLIVGLSYFFAHGREDLVRW